MTRWRQFIAALMYCGLALGAELSEQSRIAIEALLRLENVNLEQNARLKEAVNKLLGQSRGTPEFIKLVQHFKIRGQEPALLEAAIQNPNSEAATLAAKLLLENQATNLVLSAFASTNISTVTNLIHAVANTKTKEAVHLILPIVTDEKRETAARREAVKSLAQSQDGAKAILALAEEQRLADPLKFTATSELHRAPWPEIRAKAERLLPLPAGLNARPLPPLGKLVKMKGDPTNGEKIYKSPTAGCATCHQVKGQGIDFGPDLSEIGSKLAKEALYESILDPSAGISFGYEAWNIELKSGDELYGLIVSETPEELSVKSVGGAITKGKTNDIARRRKAPISIMPAGLQQSMSVQDLVDLIEYLVSLKKPGS